MTGVLNAPNDDRFMVITEHDQADLVISPEHLGIGHTAAFLAGKTGRPAQAERWEDAVDR